MRLTVISGSMDVVFLNIKEALIVSSTKQVGRCPPRSGCFSKSSRCRRVKIRGIRDNYATLYLPGVGELKIHNSRDLTSVKEVGTCTVKRKGGDRYISMLVDVPDLTPSAGY